MKRVLSANNIESGSSARNPFARISIARHFFPKCHLLNSKIVICSTAKKEKKKNKLGQFGLKNKNKKKKKVNDHFIGYL